MEPKLTGYQVSFGCDPEFFLRSKKRLLGSEEVIPETGIPGSGKLTRDGVQVEMNCQPSTCRGMLGKYIVQGFRNLKAILTERKLEVEWGVLQELPEETLKALSEKSRILGCQPSFNLYDPNAQPGVDGNTYPYRSAGGHIHLGFEMRNQKDLIVPKMVAMLDCLVGNTAVLIDRDEGNIERRKVYGRAGEYRLPPHGLEYRTLSNFWLKAYPVFHLMFGLAKMAASAVLLEVHGQSFYDYSGGGYRYEKHPYATNLLTSISQEQVQQAINSNDVNLAWENWRVVRKWIEGNVSSYPVPPTATYSTAYLGLDSSYLDAFEFFARELQEKGWKHWFPMDPLDHWVDRGDYEFIYNRDPWFLASESYFAIYMTKISSRMEGLPENPTLKGVF